MRRRSLGWPAAFSTGIVLASGASSIAGCFGATEVRLEITTTAPCEKGIETQLFVGAPGTTDFGATAADTRACGAAEPRIGTIALVPSGARNEQLDLRIVAGVGVDPSMCASGHLDGCIVARRRVSFLAHASLRLPVLLSDRCIGVPCGADESCDLGVCVKLDVCTELGCPRERGDVVVGGADGGPVEAAVDGTVAHDATSNGKCGSLPEVVVDGQSIRGQLAMQGSDFLYVSDLLGGTELRRVPRVGGVAKSTIDVTNLVAVTATDAELGFVEVYPNSISLGRQRLVDPTPTRIAYGKETSQAIGFSGAALVGVTYGANSLPGNPDAFRSFALVNAMRAYPNDTLNGHVPEIAVDEDGDWYGATTGGMVLHFAAGSATLLGSLASREPSTDIAVANRSLYVALSKAGGVATSGVGVHRIPRAWLDQSPTYAGQALLPNVIPTTLAASGSDLYFIEGTTLHRLDVTTGPPAVTLATVGPASTALAVDADCVYWVEQGKRIMKRARH
jgi:hypothetical protein